MKTYQDLQTWFVTGSQHLYGKEALAEVADHSQAIATALDASDCLPMHIVFKPVVTTAEEVHRLCLEANADPNCAGVIAWMHTFSPARMWIAGLHTLSKPLLDFHTQFNQDIPWDTIDMDFMNLNQTAHGGREFGFIGARMRRPRKIVIGHWQDEETLSELNTWLRAAAAWHDAQGASIARFGDNMRHVAVTEGDKVEAQMRLGYAVNGHGVGDLVEYVNAATGDEVEALVAEYEEQYRVAPGLRRDGAQRQSLLEAARIELGLRAFLQDGNFKAFTTTFEDLHGLAQLPGIAVQRLMADGYGFGAEGDWKTAALLRAMKVMAKDLPGGTSFMEDYTYHLRSGSMKVLGAHMLEVCPTIAADKPSLEIHPLSIGGKADPVRLVFDTPPGPGLNATIVDMGNRFRMVVNTVDVVSPDAALPNLPVARAVWVPHPNLKVATAAWAYAGGAHHTGFSQALRVTHLIDWAEIADLELLLINEQTALFDFKKELRWNDVYYRINHC